MKITSECFSLDLEKSNRNVLVDPKKQKLPCYYLKALYNTLVTLKPKYCIEIGTNTGLNSTVIFQKYFDNYMPDGVLVTCDIKKYANLDHLKNVKQLIVAHHINNISQIHRVSDDELIFDHESSVETNKKLLSEISQEYDFAFIDGDHTTPSFVKDIEICESLLKSPKVMMLDDTKAPAHECYHHYKNVIKTSGDYDCYDFEDWKQFVGASLVVRK